MKRFALILILLLSAAGLAEAETSRWKKAAQIAGCLAVASVPPHAANQARTVTKGYRFGLEYVGKDVPGQSQEWTKKAAGDGGIFSERECDERRRDVNNSEAWRNGGYEASCTANKKHIRPSRGRVVIGRVAGAGIASYCIKRVRRSWR